MIVSFFYILIKILLNIIEKRNKLYEKKKGSSYRTETLFKILERIFYSHFLAITNLD